MLNIIGENNNLGQFVGLNNRMNDRMKKYSPEFEKKTAQMIICRMILIPINLVPKSLVYIET